MNIRKILSVLLIVGLIAGFGLVISPKIVSANGPPEVWVDDDYNSSTPGWGYNHFAKIQDGIDAVADGGIVHVASGIYNEALTIQGFNGLTIQAGSKPIITGCQSVLDTSYPAQVDNIIFVNNSQNVNIIGFDIKGTGTGPNSRDFGVFYQNSSGMIKDCYIDHNTFGDMNANAIRAITNSTLVVESCTIEDYGRIGIYAKTGTMLEVYNSTLIGTVYSNPNYVNYGIEVENLDSASFAIIKWNEIYNHDNTAEAAWSSAGIIVDTWRYYMVTNAICSAIIEYNDIHNNYFGVEIVPNDNIHVNYNNIYNNHYYGAVSNPYWDGSGYVNYTLDATYNYWGANDGPSGVGPGSGDAVSANVDYDPWLRKIESFIIKYGDVNIYFTPGSSPSAMWRVVIPSKGYDSGWISFRRYTKTNNHFWGEYADTRYHFIIDFYSSGRYHIIFDDRVTGISIKIAN